MAARKAGLVYLTEDRKDKGLLLGKSLRENLTLLALDRFTRVSSTMQAEDAALTRGDSTTSTSARATGA
jgi:ribose transport system ATP-binding protein